MDTNDLITILSHSAPPRKPMSFATVLLILCIGCALMTIAVLGLRPDIGNALVSPAPLFKTLLLVSAVALAGWAVRYGATPLPLPRMSRVRLFVYGFVLLLAGSVLVEWTMVPASRILDQFFTGNFITCVLSILLYGGLGTVALIWLMRFYAPADNRSAATLIGLAAAAAGALGYSIHCPFDSPTFIAVAYGLPVLAVTLTARYYASRFIRW